MILFFFVPCCMLSYTNFPISSFMIPKPTAQSAVPGVSLGRGLLIPHGYLHPENWEHTEVQGSSMIAGASLWFMGGPPSELGPPHHRQPRKL